MRALRLLVSGCAWVLLAGTSPAADDPAIPDLPAEATPDDLLRHAAVNSPSLRAAHARWVAATEAIPQARALPDPQISYGVFVQRMDTRQIFRVEQMFPWSGNRALSGDLASTEAVIASRRLETEMLRIRHAVQTAMADQIYLKGTHRIVTDSLGLVNARLEIARGHFQTGDTAQADILRLQGRANALQTELRVLESRANSANVRLNTALGRPASAPLPIIKPGELPVLPPDAQILMRERLADTPALQAAAGEITRSETALRLARRETKPDIMAGVEYMDNRGMARDEVLGMVSLNVPIWRERYRARERQAAAETQAAEREYDDLLNAVTADVDAVLTTLHNAERTMQLYDEELIPQAQHTLRLLESRYRTGGATFADLLEARILLLDHDRDRLGARTDYLLAFAEWERLTTSDSRPTSGPRP